MPALMERSSTPNRYVQRARKLEELAERLTPILHDLLSPTASPTPSSFSNTKIPNLSLSRYLQRIMHYCPTTRSAYVVSVIYLHRVAAKCGHDFIHTNSIHRLLMASVVLGSKFCDDHFKKNSFYARVGGFTIQELNEMEVELLERLDYDLFVSKPEYIAFEKFVYATKVEDLMVKERISSHEEDLENLVPKVSASSSEPSLPSFASFSLLSSFGEENRETATLGSPETIFSSPLRQLASLFAS